MQTPPFRLSRTPNLLRADAAAKPPSAHDACCTQRDAHHPRQLSPVRRRARLTELDAHMHCSVIGTCLSTQTLRKLVPKFSTLDRQHASDLDLHHTAVELAVAGGAGGRALHKALDERYADVIRRFDTAPDEAALAQLWQQALASGEIPGAYWALMTHPATTLALRQSAFGDVHMLSHLVGAANRADIRRLVTLEQDNAVLHDKIERQQHRLQELATQRDTALRQLADHVLKLSAQSARQPELDAPGLAAEVHRLREHQAETERQLALHISRRVAAEHRVTQERHAADELRQELQHSAALLKVVQAECHALEQAALDAANQATSGNRHAGLDGVRDKRIVYVGGRPGSNAALKALVQSAGGTLVLHDGGLEDRKGLLAAALPGADMVVFPVDCIDHDSMSTLKRVCERHQIAYHPLRTASVASFLELMTRLHDEAPIAVDTVARSTFCLRHG